MGNLSLALIIVLGMGINISAKDQLEKLADKCDFFGLREELDRCSAALTHHDMLYWETVCSSFFNDCEKSLATADIYLTNFENTADAEKKLEINKIKADNLVRQCRYAEAADIYQLILNEMPEDSDRKLKNDLRNNTLLCSSLRHVPPQKTTITREHVIPYEYSSFNHILVPVKAGGVEEKFVFDTGANLSTITESQAIAMGLDIIESEIDVATSTDIKITTKLAVANHFSVGDIDFENVVFLVATDDQLSFPEIGMQIKGVVGFPIIHQMREIRINNGSIIIPQETQDRNLKNLCIEGLMPVVCGYVNGERLTFTLDTGANSSELSFRYYEKHKQRIEEEGQLVNQKRGGGGGVVDGEVYELKNFTMNLGSRQLELPKMSVVFKEYEFSVHKDGNLGLDALRHLPTIIISFEHMFVDFDSE